MSSQTKDWLYHHFQFNSLCKSPLNDDTIVAGSNTGYLVSYSASKNQILWENKEAGNGCIICVGFSPNGKNLVVGLHKGYIMVLAAESGQMLSRIECKECVRCICFSEDNDIVYCGVQDAIIVLSLIKKNIVQRIPYNTLITSLVLPPPSFYAHHDNHNIKKNAVIFVGDCDRGINMISLQNGICFKSYRFFRQYIPSSDCIMNLKFSSSGMYLYASTGYGRCARWNIHDDIPITHFSVDYRCALNVTDDVLMCTKNTMIGSVESLLLIHNDTILVVVPSNQDITLWDVDTGELMETIERKFTIENFFPKKIPENMCINSFVSDDETALHVGCKRGHLEIYALPEKKIISLDHSVELYFPSPFYQTKKMTRMNIFETV